MKRMVTVRRRVGGDAAAVSGRPAGSGGRNRGGPAEIQRHSRADSGDLRGPAQSPGAVREQSADA